MQAQIGESITSCFASPSLWSAGSSCPGELERGDPPSGAVFAWLFLPCSEGSAPRAAASTDTAPNSFAYPLHTALSMLIHAAHYASLLLPGSAGRAPHAATPEDTAPKSFTCLLHTAISMQLSFKDNPMDT